MIDKVSKGRALNGEDHGNSKLTWNLVRSIRASQGSCHEIGLKYGISSSQVSNIKRGKQWKEGRDRDLNSEIEELINGI